MELQENGRLVGCLSIRAMGPDRLQGNVGVTVNSAFRRKGLGTEALAALLDFCFEDISMHRVTASCDNTDAASLRMLEKLGLRREGLFLKDRWLVNEWTDTAYFALLGEEYRASTSDVVGGTSP